MLPPDRSPVHRVVMAALSIGEITHVLRARYSHASWRATVWDAAAQEVELKRDSPCSYNPSDDARIKWLLQWCDVLEGSRRAIEDRITASMEFVCQIPAPISGKQLACGERHETLTLAQGS